MTTKTNNILDAWTYKAINGRISVDLFASTSNPKSYAVTLNYRCNNGKTRGRPLSYRLPSDKHFATPKIKAAVAEFAADLAMANEHGECFGAGPGLFD